jgi:hypothetical protein
MFLGISPQQMPRDECRMYIAAILCVAVIMVPSMGHVPLLVEGNDHLENAAIIEDPTKSWVVYDQLDHEGDARYYRMEMEEGEELRLSLFVPDRSTFSPGMVVMGPGLGTSPDVPDWIEVPMEAGSVVVPGEDPDLAEYEPFTPSALYNRARFSRVLSEPGTYWVGVYEPDEGGRFGLAVGYREEFSLVEWGSVPVTSIGIHQWEGQPLWLILSPLLLALFAGFAIIGLRRRKRGVVPEGSTVMVAAASGLFFIGSGLMVLLQMGIALNATGLVSSAVVTLFFAILPLILGFSILWIAILRKGEISRRNGVNLAIIGLIGLLTWSGLIIGPFLAIGAGLMAVLRYQ